MNKINFTKNDRILYESCPICQMKETEFLREDDWSTRSNYDDRLSKKIVWKVCNFCSHIFTEGYFIGEAKKILLSIKKDSQNPEKYDVEHNRYLSASIIDKVSNYLIYQEGEPWLDIGFGNGSLLVTLDEYGFIAQGMEIDKDACSYMKDKGFQVYTSLRNPELYYYFTVISMCDVLEHTVFPLDLLRTVHGLLNENGILFISCPNRDSYLWDYLTEKDQNPYWSEIEHYHNFSRIQLCSMLKNSGFEVLNYSINSRYRIGMDIIARKVK